MMKKEIKIPSVGESIKEVLISLWKKKSGDWVNRDELLLILETEKASVEMVSEESGILEILVPSGNTIDVGTLVGFIDIRESAKPLSQASSTQSQSQGIEVVTNGSKSVKKEEVPLSPATRRMVNENQINMSSVTGTGKDGRLTKGDLLKVIEEDLSKKSTVSVETKVEKIEKKEGTKEPTSTQGLVRRVEMTPIRKKIADRLVEVQKRAAILTTFNEVDMSQILKIRNDYKEEFKEKYGVSLGFMGFFTKASIEALKEFPEVNAFIEGNEIVYHDYFHIGIAVGTEAGLLVPVLQNVEDLSIAEIEQKIADLAKRARDRKIFPDELQGGTFTISNGGVYGSLLSTPILNPPQSGILGMHKIEERPIALKGQVVIRPMMYLALSYDHRLIDGKGAVSFLVRIKECLEDPQRIWLGV